MITVRARFDGRTFMPEEAVNLPVGAVVEIPIDSATPAAEGLEDQFQQLAMEW